MDWQIIEPHQIPSLAISIQNWDAVAFDTETNGLDPWLGHRPIGIGLSPVDGDKHYYLPLTNLRPQDLIPVLEALSTKTLLGHDIKFDMHMLTSIGWKPGLLQRFVDTIIGLRLWSREEHPQLGLKENGKKIFNYEYSNPKVVAMVKSGRAQEVPLPDLAHYCCEDVWLTKKLYHWVRKQLSPALCKLYVREIELTRELYEMEERGAMIDDVYLHRAVDKLDEELLGLLHSIKESSGLEEFNPRSGPQTQVLMKQLGIKPVKATPKGGVSWDRDACLQVRDQHPIALLNAKYRALAYQRSGTIERASGYLEAGCPDLHFEFKNWGTVTGRLSGNGQQLTKGWLQFGESAEKGDDVLVWVDDHNAKEREFSLRRLIRPREGKTLIKADYKQIEMFILGYYMKDPTFSNWLESEHGVHYAVGEEIWGDGEKFKARGKVYNFASVYGQGIRARAKSLGCTDEESKRYGEEYHARMPGYRKFLNRVRRLLERDGYVSNIYGRNYYLPGEFAYKGVNYLCQGSAGDFVKFRLPATRELRRQIGLDMLMTTHDDFVGEIDNEDVPLLKEWFHELRQSPFERELDIDIEYSLESLVQLHPIEEILAA